MAEAIQAQNPLGPTEPKPSGSDATAVQDASKITLVGKEGQSQSDTVDILHEVRYLNNSNEYIFTRALPKPAAEIEAPSGVQPPVMKVVEVRKTWLDTGAPELSDKDVEPKNVGAEAGTKSDQPSFPDPDKSLEPEKAGTDGETKADQASSAEAEKKSETELEKSIKLPPFHSQHLSYIEIQSPAVREALRTAVTYYPEHDLETQNIKVHWPYPLLFHHHEELDEFQQKFQNHKCDKAGCFGQYASRHIGVVKEFMNRISRNNIEEEIKRNERGFATFEMLWWLYRPGEDVLLDKAELGEYEPYVIKELDWTVLNGRIRSYIITFWNMNADSVSIGPTEEVHTIYAFAGEKEITSLRTYPFRFLKKDRNGRTADQVRQRFIDRGKTFFKLRNKGCWDYKGFSTTFPRRPFEGTVMVDPIQHYHDQGNEPVSLQTNFETDNVKLVNPDSCDIAQGIVESLRRPFKFPGYSKINPLKVEGLTDHQYFLCDRTIEAFIFKLREWRSLDISGISQIHYDKKMLDMLVLEPHTKKLIQSLTAKYIRTLRKDDQRENSLSNPDDVNVSDEEDDTAWSADFVKGKGEGLIFLLHGKPGVGKTYTAECIAANAERPLLTLTCTDIGTNPAAIETNLMRWFKLAKNWNAIMLIDEADIYMEHRMVQDLERNNLVAGFLRAMEYYKGILFLTTNRVGTFDEAFISRINLTIYYKPFSAKARREVWESFFGKLEREKEGKMRIHAGTRDYVEDSEELQQLQWNGRDIRNAFQIAVALAEAEGDRDARGRIIIKKDHIRPTVEMSREFKQYLKKVHKKDEDAIAAARGIRYDAGSTELSEETSFRFTSPFSSPLEMTTAMASVQ